MFNFIRRSIKRNFGVDKEYYRFIDDMFGFVPNNIELYKVALIHKSASQSIGGHHINNERLEYLGDAVIESITSDYLFIAYPDQDEGFLTQMRSKIVSRQSLNEMAVFIGLDKYLICKSGVTLQQKHIYGDAFEAMMGAIYLDKGYEFTNRLLINDIFERFLSIDELSCSENDFKSRLIEWCQKNRHSLDFRTVKGNDRKSSVPVFYTTVFIDGIEMGHGVGDSKKSSEQSAACSVTREMSDEECAKLLDKLDRMMVADEAPKHKNTKPEGGENGGERSKHHNKNRNRKQQEQELQPEPVVVEVAETPVSEPAAEGETQPESAGEHTSKRRRGRRRKPAEGVAEAQQPTAEMPQTESPEPQSEPTEQGDGQGKEQPAKRRRVRRKNSEGTAEQPQDAQEVQELQPEQNESAEEQPAKRRRSRRKKTSEAETAVETSAETVE